MIRKTLNNIMYLTFLLTVLSAGSAIAAQGGTPAKVPVGTLPGAKEAIVCTGVNFTGTCYRLTRNIPNDYSAVSWTCYDANWGFPNDAIQSIRMGSAVRLTLFWSSLATADNGAVWVGLPGGTYPTLNNWNRKASAARLVDANRDPTCWDTQSGEFALWTDANYTGDCVVLSRYSSTWGRYGDPVSMCFRNDSASSAWNDVNYWNFDLWLFRDAQFNYYLGSIAPYSGYAQLPWNDQISSVEPSL